MGEERVALMVFIVSPADFLGQQLLFCLIHEEVLEVFFPKRLLAQFVDERLALLFLWVFPVGPLLADGVGAVAQFRAVEQFAQHGHVGLRLSVVQIDLMAPRHPCEVRRQSRFFKLPFDVAIDDGPSLPLRVSRVWQSPATLISMSAMVASARRTLLASLSAPCRSRSWISWTRRPKASYSVKMDASCSRHICSTRVS